MLVRKCVSIAWLLLHQMRGKISFEHHFSCIEIALAILEFLFRAKREVEIATRRKALQVVGGGRGSDKKERE